MKPSTNAQNPVTRFARQQQFFSFIYKQSLAAEAVGTVENSASFAEFSKRGGKGGKHAVRFPRFPPRGSFHSLRSKVSIVPNDRNGVHIFFARVWPGAPEVARALPHKQ